MSKIIIISNTLFNTSKQLGTSEWLKNMENYFNKEFIPYLEENAIDNDILVHLGNLTSKTKNIDLKVLNSIQDIFKRISDILPVYIISGPNDKLSINILRGFNNITLIKEPREVKLLLEQKFAMLPYGTKLKDINQFKSDYCFFNFDYKDGYLEKFKKCYNGFYDKNSVFSNVKNISSPYNIDNDDVRGFVVLETHINKDKFIVNKISPKFKRIKIDKDDDINIDRNLLKNNYVDISINKELFKDNKLKLEMLLSENDFLSVSYTDDETTKDKEETINIDGESLSIDDIIKEWIEKNNPENKDELLSEFDKIKKMYN